MRLKRKRLVKKRTLANFDDPIKVIIDVHYYRIWLAASHNSVAHRVLGNMWCKTYQTWFFVSWDNWYIISHSPILLAKVQITMVSFTTATYRHQLKTTDTGRCESKRGRKRGNGKKKRIKENGKQPRTPVGHRMRTHKRLLRRLYSSVYQLRNQVLFNRIVVGSTKPQKVGK